PDVVHGVPAWIVPQYVGGPASIAPPGDRLLHAASSIHVSRWTPFTPRRSRRRATYLMIRARWWSAHLHQAHATRAGEPTPLIVWTGTACSTTCARRTCSRVRRLTGSRCGGG